MIKMVIEKATAKNKKLKAIFYDEKGKKIKSTSFGSAGADDYTKTKDKAQRERYLKRHRQRENWNDFQSSGALSRWLLWGPYTDLNKNIKAYKRRFKLK
jgi:hypothetical protein